MVCFDFALQIPAGLVRHRSTERDKGRRQYEKQTKERGSGGGQTVWETDGQGDGDKLRQQTYIDKSKKTSEQGGKKHCTYA